MSAPDDGRSRPVSVLSHLGSMLAVSVILGVVAAGLAIPFAAVAGLTAGNVSDSLQELPDELETEALAQSSRILASDGTTIATLYDENRVNVPLRQMAKVMRQAIVSIEDYRFYQHGALDVKGTLRAFITNQASGSTRQGGSSITQQMVKLTLISQAKDDDERKAAQAETIARKLRELRYAIAFEENYSKDWILERYLNIAYFGDGVYGVQAAAKHYFSKDARKLNLREAATLAGLVKNPVGYDPITFPDKALSRRNVVLDRMAQLKVISEERAEKIKSQGLRLKITSSRNGCLLARAPIYCDYVVNYLTRDPALGKTPEDRLTLLKSGGLTIRTSLDLRFQDAADASVRNHVRQNESAIGSLALIQPRTGNVKAISQSRPLGLKEKMGETSINYAVPKEEGGARGFQAGSTFKAFVLADAIRQKISLNTTIDSPKERTFQEADYKNCDGQPYGYGSFSIPNSTTSGPKNLYTGTRESVNTFYMALEQLTGICTPYRLAKQMGVNLTNPVDSSSGSAERVPTFTLGVADATPLEMAEAYATFAARGLHCDARPVTKIEDANGTLLKDYPRKCTQVLPSAVADAVNDVLRGVQEGDGFGAINGLALGQQSAGKTGTTNSANSVWFVGYTPNLAGASMIAGVKEDGGPDSLIGKTIGGSTLYSASGSGTAGPMWGDAMHVIEQWLDDETFTPPSSTEISGVLVDIPPTGGMNVDDAKATLEDLGFKVIVASGQVDSSYNQGTVAYTDPGSGGQQSSGDVVTIYVSDGSPYVPPKQDPPKKKKKKPGRGRGR
ncbi:MULTISPECIES: penicillin-binding protein [unclassified Nocardioides]|uniref:penicillin-binding protein n=1 Tax=unclassified Nocardioides TaxID=2615069 RepID=UPI0012E3E5D8|nr:MULTISPECIES: transglycosylase domain-containing protein [unclassified Nocardioides]